MTRARLAAVVAAIVLGAACSGGTDVGDERLLDFDQEQAGRLGATTAPPAATATVATPSTISAPAPTTPRTTTTLPPEAQVVTIDVAINEASPYFDPEVVQVRVGGRVRFTNRGVAAHSVVADTGAFDSGDIAPGAAWIFEAGTPGRFNYSDGRRPYAVGVIEAAAS